MLYSDAYGIHSATQIIFTCIENRKCIINNTQLGEVVLVLQIFGPLMNSGDCGEYKKKTN